MNSFTKSVVKYKGNNTIIELYNEKHIYITRIIEDFTTENKFYTIE